MKTIDQLDARMSGIEFRDLILLEPGLSRFRDPLRCLVVEMRTFEEIDSKWQAFILRL